MTFKSNRVRVELRISLDGRHSCFFFYLDEVDVVLSARQLGDLTVSLLQVCNLVIQTLHVALCAVECSSLVRRYKLGHLLLHPLYGAHHVAKHLLTFLQRPLGRVLQWETGGVCQINHVVATQFFFSILKEGVITLLRWNVVRGWLI